MTQKVWLTSGRYGEQAAQPRDHDNEYWMQQLVHWYEWMKGEEQGSYAIDGCTASPGSLVLLKLTAVDMAGEQCAEQAQPYKSRAAQHGREDQAVLGRRRRAGPSAAVGQQAVGHGQGGVGVLCGREQRVPQQGAAAGGQQQQEGQGQLGHPGQQQPAAPPPLLRPTARHGWRRRKHRQQQPPPELAHASTPPQNTPQLRLAGLA